MAQGISKLPEGSLNHLQKKIIYTLFFLAVYRIGVVVTRESDNNMNVPKRKVTLDQTE